VSDIVVAIIRKRLDYLPLREADVEQFAQDFAPVMRSEYRYAAAWAGILAPAYQFVDVFQLSPRSLEFRLFEEYVVGMFLLSTDFFWSGPDANRPVNYVALHDPYRRICLNPFARIS
jgi:hypothetical protein